MNYYNLTNQQTADLATGAIAGSAMTSYLMGLTVMAVLLIVAWWKIFTKAGVAGWKSLIPIYNVIVLFKIIGINPWCILLSLIPFFGMIIIEVWMAVRLAKVFGKGTGTIAGLIFFPNIFTLIIGFGSAEYQGADYGK